MRRPYGVLRHADSTDGPQAAVLSVAAAIIGAMSDDGGGLHVRQGPRKRTGELSVADFTMLVRVPGKPAAVRVYTGEEQDEAARYAAESGGVVVPLPLSPPTGYEPAPDGTLTPATATPEDHAPS
jgi:hypothetical protein